MKYTNEEIIRALKHCAKGNKCIDCTFESRCFASVEFVAKQALGVIERQQATLEANK